MKVYFILLFSLIIIYSNAQGDLCSNAVSLTPTFTECNWTFGSSANATLTMSGCSGNADDDVWYTFIANSKSMNIKVDPSTGYDPVLEVFSGNNCLGNSIICRDNYSEGTMEEVSIDTLTIGNNYTFRVYHYSAGSGSSDFKVCVSGVLPPNNNSPCNAYPLPIVSSSYHFQKFTNENSLGSSVANPSGCSGSSPFQGGYAGGDVWFSVIVPASGKLDIYTREVEFADGSMALYEGSCSSPILVECNDDGGAGTMPYIYKTGLTPGTTMYIRIWEFGNNNNGLFQICVASPDNDECNNPKWIDNQTGHEGLTSNAYTPDMPGNMSGTGQDGTVNSDPSAPFGNNYTGSLLQNSPIIVEHNSWLIFKADSSVSKFRIRGYEFGSYFQVQIFSAINCNNFIPISDFHYQGSEITATGLTVGQNYYIMIDRFSEDLYSYSITPLYGVKLTELVVQNNNLCLGDSTTITASTVGNGNYIYSWTSIPSGSYSNSNIINVTPSVTTDYELNIYDQTNLNTPIETLQSTVVVNDIPVANINSFHDTLCFNSTLNINANISGGTQPYSHLWTGNGSSLLNSTNTSNPIFTPSSSGNYTLTYQITDLNSCSNEYASNIAVLPELTSNYNNTICSGNNIIINGTTYDESNTTGIETFTNIGAHGCDSIVTVNLTINSIDTSSTITDSTITIAQSGATYQWLDCNDSDSQVNGETSQIISPFINGTYKAEISKNGCIDTSSCVTINPCNEFEIISVSNSSICDTSSSTLSILNSYDNYSWSNGSNLDSIIVTDSSIYSATLSMNNGCITLSDSVKINLFDCAIFIDTTINNVDTCLIDSTTIVMQSYINNIITTNDSIFVTWNFLLNTGDTVFLDAGYTFDQNGVYSIGITINCNGLKASGGTTYFDLIEINHISTSIKETEIKDLYRLSPNPTKEYISIISELKNKDITIDILSINGALIKSQFVNTSSSITLDLKELENAIYLVRITDSNSKSLIYKIIKNN